MTAAAPPRTAWPRRRGRPSSTTPGPGRIRAASSPDRARDPCGTDPPPRPTCPLASRAHRAGNALRRCRRASSTPASADRRRPAGRRRAVADVPRPSLADQGFDSSAPADSARGLPAGPASASAPGTPPHAPGLPVSERRGPALRRPLRNVGRFRAPAGTAALHPRFALDPDMPRRGERSSADRLGGVRALVRTTSACSRDRW